jgi:hypothetical protein
MIILFTASASLPAMRASIQPPEQAIPIPIITGMKKTLISQGEVDNPGQEEIEWIYSLVGPEGVFMLTPGGNKVVPYFSNLAVQTLVRHGDSKRPEIRVYLQWYVDHTNPDGSIDDFERVNGMLVPTGAYDSADSYAATFLSLVADYERASGDKDFVRQNWLRLGQIGGLLASLQDIDGLIWAKPGYRVKFLMDNAEDYRGLLDYADLLARYDSPEAASYTYEMVDRLAAGVQSKLWLDESQSFAWALYGRYLKALPRHKFYPDDVAQLYPIVYGLLSPMSSRAQNLYGQFNQHYPYWSEEPLPDDNFPWAVLAYAATLMGDRDRAAGYLAYAEQKFVLRGGQFPWHAAEAGFFVKAWAGVYGIMPAAATVPVTRHRNVMMPGGVFEAVPDEVTAMSTPVMEASTLSVTTPAK